jgi:sugar lactone lactonase YvrE
MTLDPLLMINRILAAACLTTVAVACNASTDMPPSAQTESSVQADASLPATIVAERGGFIPEGIEYDATNGRILTGSLSEGSIFQIHPDGRVTTVVGDPDLVSSVGIEVDAQRNRLLVANSDRAVFEGVGTGQAMLGVYDLSTGNRIEMIDLASTIEGAPADMGHFANDVAVVADGTVYVTDTFADVIYRVDPDYQASVFYQPDTAEALGFNGIVAHPDGYLLVAGGETLWKVPLDSPYESAPVVLPEAVPGQDGMVWMTDGNLAIVSNSSNRVVALTSSDNWMTAQVAGVAPYETQATTAAVVGDEVYIVHPHFADEDPPSVSRAVFQ